MGELSKMCSKAFISSCIAMVMWLSCSGQLVQAVGGERVEWRWGGGILGQEGQNGRLIGSRKGASGGSAC